MRPKILVALAVLAGAFAFAGSQAADKAPEEWDGLQKTKIKGLGLAYVRPGVDMSAYKKIMLDPIEVSFSKDWKPEQRSGHYDISQSDRDAIKERIVSTATEAFTDTLSKKDGYPIVTAAAPDVMRVTAGLLDVYINAPDTDEPGRVTSYVTTAGRLTMIAELRDSETGALFARVIDKTEARSTGLSLSNRVQNSAELRRMVNEWAGILRKRLDAVHAPAGSAQN